MIVVVVKMPNGQVGVNAEGLIVDGAGGMRMGNSDDAVAVLTDAIALLTGEQPAAPPPPKPAAGLFLPNGARLP
jgi:hypothetical protein